MNHPPELRGRGEAKVAEVDVVLQCEGELPLGEAVGLSHAAAVEPLDVRLVGEDPRVVGAQEVLEVGHLGAGKMERKPESILLLFVLVNLLLWRQMQIVNEPKSREDINAILDINLIVSDLYPS